MCATSKDRSTGGHGTAGEDPWVGKLAQTQARGEVALSGQVRPAPTTAYLRVEALLTPGIDRACLPRLHWICAESSNRGGEACSTVRNAAGCVPAGVPRNRG